jgi:hypothetical protein
LIIRSKVKRAVLADRPLLLCQLQVAEQSCAGLPVERADGDGRPHAIQILVDEVRLAERIIGCDLLDSIRIRL